MPRRLERLRRLTAVAVLGLLALSGRLWMWGRAAILDGRDTTRFFVTTDRDAGPGSLREAIFAADRAERAATIELRTRRIALQSPLPPLVNPRGIDIDGREFHTEIDARAISRHSVLEVRAPDSVVSGVRLEGSPAVAILVRAPRVVLDSISVSESADGVVLTDEATDLAIRHSHFESNDTGIRIEAFVPRVSIQNNTFSRHGQQAIRAVLPRPTASSSELHVRENEFDNDRTSIVLINVGGLVEDNVFTGARDAAVFVTGRDAIVRGNRAQDGAALGIVADDAQEAVIEANEISHNAAIGLLVRAGDGTLARGNRVYGNAYGIAIVFGGQSNPHDVRDNLLMNQTQDALYIVGSSPLVAGNRALASRAAALRVLEFVPLRGARLPSNPYLDHNVFEQNLVDAPIRGEYRVRPTTAKR